MRNSVSLNRKTPPQSRLERTPPQPLPTRGRGLIANLPRFDRGKAVPRFFSSLVGEMAGRPEGVRVLDEPVFVECPMPHSNIDPKARKRARTLRSELTKAEREMWDLLRDLRPRGARFRRETPIGPYIADFAWLSARVIVEVDGDDHETDHGRAHDMRRDEFLRKQGFTVLRFDNDQVIGNPDYVTISLEKSLEELLTSQGDQA